MKRFPIHQVALPLAIGLCILLAAPSDRAQNSPIGALAAQTANAISNAKQKSVVVFDFVGPDRSVNALGRTLADDFSVALSKSANKFTVINRSDLLREIESNRLSPEAAADPHVAVWLARRLKATSIILGNLDLDATGVTVEATSYELRSKAIKSFETTFPVSKKVETLVKTEVDPDAAIPVFDPKAKGFVMPACIQCAKPDYTPAAVDKKLEGTAVLDAVIGLDGRAKDIRVRKSLGLGLTVKAIQTVQSWTLKPAKGPDGKPIAIRIPIEIMFRLY